jgi:hypothetical protein
MPSRQRQHFRSTFRSLLAVETLETRALLAGNVTAAVTRGTLVIRGDGEANQIIISKLNNSGGITITPVDGSNTTINTATAPLTLNGAQRLDIKMGAGNDIVGIGNDLVVVGDMLDALADYSGDPQASLMAVEEDAPEEGLEEEENMGDDEFSILTFLGGEEEEEAGFDIGNPDFTVQQLAQLPTKIAGLTTIDLGDGDDTLAYTLRTNSNIQVEGGKGSDKILSMLTSANDMTINADPRKGAGMGDDLAVVVLASVRSDLAISTGAQDDAVVLLDTNVDNLGVGTGGVISGEMTDDDVVVFANVSASDNVGIQTEAGDDSVFIDTIIADQFRITTGEGDDAIDILSAALVTLVIDTADGNDWVGLSPGEESVAPLVIRRNLTINTGADDDEVQLDGGLLGLLVGGVLDIRTGTGDDGLLLYRVNARSAFLDMDSGNDSAVLDSVDVRSELSLNMGAGNDVLSVRNLTGQRLTVKGGTGNDTLHDLGDHHEEVLDSQFEHEDEESL